MDQIILPLLQQSLNPTTPHSIRIQIDHQLSNQLINQHPNQFLLALTQLTSNYQCPIEIRLQALVLLRTVPLDTSKPNFIWSTLLTPDEQRAILHQLFIILLSNTDSLPPQIIHHLGHTIADLAQNCSDPTSQACDQWLDQWRPTVLANLLPQLQHPPLPNNPLIQTALLNILIALPHLFSTSSQQLTSILQFSLDSDHFPLRLAALQTICVPVLDLRTSLTDSVHRSILLPLLNHTNSSQVESALGHLTEFVTFNEVSDLPAWLDPLLQLVLNQNNPISIRSTALECSINLIECGALTPEALSLNWLQPLFQALVRLMAEIAEDQNWSLGLDDNDQDQDAIYVQAEQALDRVTQEVARTHSDQLFELILSLLQQQPPPTAWQARHALLSALAVTGEGLSQSYSLAPEHIYHILQSGFNDPHPRVVYAAIYAIAQLSSPLKALFSTHPFHHQVLTWLMSCLERDSEPRIQAYAAKALINVLWDEKQGEGSNSASRIIPDVMVGPILARLISLCDSSHSDRKTRSNKIRLDALNAIQILFCSMSKEGALAFYDTTLSTLRNLLQLIQVARKDSSGDELIEDDIDETELKVFEVIGRIAMACGDQKFDSDASWWTNQMMAALELRPKGQSRILNSLARVCVAINPERCIHEGFLPRILERLLLVWKSKPDISISSVLDNSHHFDGREWEPVVIGEQTFGIKSDELDDKELSVQTLILLVKHFGAWLISSYDQIVEAVIPMLKFYFSDQARSSTIGLLPLLLQTAKTSGMTVEQLSAISTNFCNAIADAFSVEPLDPCNLADDLLIGWADCVAIQTPSNEEIIKMVDLSCQRIEKVKLESNNHHPEEYDPPEDEQYNEDLLRLFTAISRVLRISIGLLPDYVWMKFQNLVVVWVQIQNLESPIHRGLKRLGFRLVGAFVLHSSVSKGFGPELLSKVGQNILDGFQDEDECVRGLAPFIVGLCAEKNGESTGSLVYVELIKSSIDLLVNGLKIQSSSSGLPAGRKTEAVQVAKENCVSALAKIIRNPEGVSMDVESVLPRWIDALPIEIDVEEVEPSYGLLLELIARGHESVDPTKNEIQRVEQVIKSLVTAIKNKSTRIESRSSLKVGLRNYLTQLPSSILEYKDQVLNRYHSHLQSKNLNQFNHDSNQNNDHHLLDQSVWVQLELLSDL